MRLRPVLVVLAGTLFASLLAGCSALQQSIKNQPCVLDPERPFDVVEVDFDRHDLRLLWKDPEDRPFKTFERARAFLAARGDSVVALTNAGIYEPGYVPTGLFVEAGVVEHPLNLEDGKGNFFLKPNGVFFVSMNSKARIVASEEYAAISSAVRSATQSGPLLLRDGRIHPAFQPGSQNCRLRSGIGVTENNTVYLAISNGAVNFYDFATFFRDRLGATDALYLDGDISQLYAPGLGRAETGRHAYAGILAVIHKKLPSAP